MTDVLIRLERPATLTPELRAWIGDRLGPRRAILTRRRGNGPGEPTLLLRITTESGGEQAKEDELDDLLTDLRLLGLSPTLLGVHVGGGAEQGVPAGLE
jgi:hypothetical protein